MTKVTVALYARVSTSDKDQDPETQIQPLREHCETHGWTVSGEYIDTAPASDLRRRTAWRELLDAAAAKRFKAVFVFALDRAFRSVKDMHDTLAAWDLVGVEFGSLTQGFETSTPLGRLQMNFLAALAEFELEMISGRVTAGMERARRQGIPIGRPRSDAGRGFADRFAGLLPDIRSGKLTKGRAADELGISHRTLNRYLAAAGE